MLMPSSAADIAMESAASTESHHRLHDLQVHAAKVLVTCTHLEPVLAFFLTQLGFEVDAFFPADQPHTASARSQCHPAEFCFFFVLSGSVQFDVDGQEHELVRDDCITIPDRAQYRLSHASADLQLLEVTLPANPCA